MKRFRLANLKQWHLSLLLLVAGVFSSGCGANWQWGQYEVAAAGPTPVQRFTIGPSSIRSGLPALSAYQANLSLNFEGTYQGEPVAGQIESRTEVSRPALAQYRHLKVAGQGEPAGLAGGPWELLQVEGETYYKQGEIETWTQFPAGASAADSLMPLQPEWFIRLPGSVSTPPRLENLNSLSVQHFTFTEADLNDPELIFSRAQGEVWVARPDNYVVQYVISATLRVALPHPKAHLFDEGSMQLRYSLDKINAGIELTRPESVATRNNLLDTLPRLPDARRITVLPTLIEYTSVISPISATRFYRRELHALAWQEENSTIFNEKAQLTFTRDGQHLHLLITPLDMAQNVKVSLSLTGN